MTILDPRVWLAFIVALSITAAGCYFKGHADGVRTTAAAAQKAQAEAVAAARAEEQRRTAAQQENANHAAKERDQARADAAAAASAADGLRKQVATLIERARHPAATTGSAAAGDALDLLADVLGRVDERAGELAEYADRARIAGQQCERDYDALTKPIHTNKDPQ
ncbi:DUF2514 domain-containing protein [Burkholderia multivorans]|uniref:DUF2514 family protein n=1 Tax=Burkholderia multivorans TaxID=87883 RepID=UPI0009E0DD12|nr:DUF2514 family protein [Burkholderia multivorans]MCO1435458.1 DUF2514 domain-containing protein [Burkholderia multivorans]UQN59165.1 DUF2514 domain-containing protein [Burkholderia multivorans]UQN67519.1 DUF2514 domain-containing protein [Burkholderia multivorans]UQO04916.1 DUF2514 domain-containing protein [Burkholderia multivorans]UQO04975.1 DUF2514 domain-containing protein [Burkholderia multivorans]